jgi:hypothetical protein
MGKKSQSLIGLHVQSCTHWLRPCNPTPPSHPPHLGSYTRALLVSQDSITSLCCPLFTRKTFTTSLPVFMARHFFLDNLHHKTTYRNKEYLGNPEITMRCRLFELTNSLLVYERQFREKKTERGERAIIGYVLVELCA